MKAYMIYEDEAVVLQNVVIHKTRVLEPLRAAVQEAIDSSSWLDLQIYLPLDLLEHHSEDARGLVETVAPNCTASIQAEGALLLSPTMLENAQKNCLPAAIHVFVRKKAKERYDEKEAELASTTKDEAELFSAKQKRKLRQTSKSET